jgi:hypothetical protein
MKGLGIMLEKLNILLERNFIAKIKAYTSAPSSSSSGLKKS